MARFLHPKHGEVEAVRFVRRGPSDPDLLSFDGNEDCIDWVVDALNEKRLDLGALGTSLTIDDRGVSLGLAPGDWVVRKENGDLTSCRGDRFEQEYASCG